jgi:glycosyltransferase involved in cell wall biosynthesis
MRVALVCDWFLKYTAPLAAALARGGTEVTLLCCDHAREFGGSTQERAETLERAADAGVRVLTLSGVGSAAGLRRTNPDVVHAQLNANPRLLGATRGLPTVLTVHDPVPHPGDTVPPVHRRLVRRAWLRRADRIIVHGAALRDELAARVDRARIAVVPHGTSVQDAPDPPPPERRLLVFGRLKAYKGLPTLARAMETVWAARPEVRLAALGQGDAAAALPADPRVERDRRFVPEPDVVSALRRSSLVVLPYDQASQSGVGLLALGRGIPAIVTRVGALPELAIDDSQVVPPQDPAALAGAILNHLDHGEELRLRVLEHARRNFSWEVAAGGSLRVYREAEAARRSHR